MKQWFKDKVDSLNGSGKTKWLLCGIGGVLVIAFIRAAYNDNQAGLYEKQEENQQQGVIAPTVRDPSITTIMNENAMIKREFQNINNRLEQIGKTGINSQSMSREEVVRLVEELRKNDIGGLSEKNPFEDQSISEKAASEISGGTDQQDLSPGATEQKSLAETTARKSRFSFQSSSNSSPDTQAASDDNKTFLPPGTSLPYVSVSGVNAPTNLKLDGKDENAPMVLLRLKGKGIMPNGFTTDLSECFVLAPVYGQYMDSRAIARTAILSCIRDDGKAVEVKLEGQINGEDGKPGWRGRTVSKTGKVLAGLARVGALQAGSETLTGVANGIKINVGSSSSDSDTRTQINLGGTAGQSIAKNMGSAFEKMATIYENRATDAIPVIEVEPLRTGEIIVQKGVTLDFSKDVR